MVPDTFVFPSGHNDTLVCKILQIMRCSPCDPGFALQCHAEPIKGANRLMKSFKSEPNMRKVKPVIRHKLEMGLGSAVHPLEKVEH
jgi:hypothetical protein